MKISDIKSVSIAGHKLVGYGIGDDTDDTKIILKNRQEKMTMNTETQTPRHPGELIGLKIKACGLTVSAAARHLQVSRSTLSRLIAGKASLSLNMAVNLGEQFRMNPRLLLTLQMELDINKLTLDRALENISE